MTHFNLEPSRQLGARPPAEKVTLAGSVGRRECACSLLLAALALVSGCSDEGAKWVEALPQLEPAERAIAEGASVDLLQLQPTSEGFQLGRVELRPPAPEETDVEEVRQGRAGATRVLSDQRLSFTTPLGTNFEQLLPRGDWSGAGLLFDVALVPASEDENTDDALVDLLLSAKLLSGGSSQELARGRLELDAQERHRWVSLAATLPAHLAQGAAWSLSATSVTGKPLPLEMLERRLAIGAPILIPARDSDSQRAPDVVLISIDTLRADRLGCYGYGRDTSPNLDRLATSGALFEHCSSPSPWTLPAYGTLFTSRYPTEHRAGVSEKADIWVKGGTAADYKRHGQSLALDAPTLAESMARAGYMTAGIYSNPFLNPKSMVDRGFGSYTWYQYNALSAVQLAEKWWQAKSAAPRFLFLQVTDPHYPYAPPAPFDERFAGRSLDSIANYPHPLPALRNNEQSAERKKLLSDLYDAEVAFTDEQLGKFLELVRAGEGPNGTLIVVHSDHGEELWDHERFEHGHSMYEELLRVPLVFHWPGQIEATRVAGRVRSMDVFPTVVDLLGLPLPENLRGTSLRAHMGEEPLPLELVSYSESILWGRPYVEFDEAKALTLDGYKVVVGDNNGLVQLFDLSADPLEKRDLADEMPERAQELSELLLKHYQRAEAAGARGVEMTIREAEYERLQRLGYFDSEEDSKADDIEQAEGEGDEEGRE